MYPTLVQKVESALDSIRPYLQSDGGNVKLLEITQENVVKLELEGSCVTCPMSSMTMRAGIEKAIKESVPEIKAVWAINANLTNSIP
jgi:Fe-S cluster biogenesis protein NfuA